VFAQSAAWMGPTWLARRMKPSRIIRFARFAGGSGSSSHARFSDIYSSQWARNSRKVLPSNILYSLLLLAVSNNDSGSHIVFFWQKSSVELIMVGSWPALRGGPSTIFQLYRHSLPCTYCTNSRSWTANAFTIETNVNNPY
jgi:hypothetical protein